MTGTSSPTRIAILRAKRRDLSEHLVPDPDSVSNENGSRCGRTRSTRVPVWLDGQVIDRSRSIGGTAWAFAQALNAAELSPRLTAGQRPIQVVRARAGKGGDDAGGGAGAGA